MKRKYIKLFLLVIVLILPPLIIITMCNKKSNLEVGKCTFVSDQSASGYVSTTNYEINHLDDIVDNIKIVETIESSDKNILSFFKEELSKQYKSANDLYGGYKYDIKEEDNKLIVTTTIDYNNVDITKFVEDNPGMKDYVNTDNKLTFDGVIKMYKNIGATCE